MTKSLSRYWLLLGVSALAVAGLFSLVLVIARAPALYSMPFFNRVFHESLVVHVDLSVLVWFLSIACLLWSLAVEGSRQAFPLLEEGALICFALGAFAVAVSPLDPHGNALMSNYIPVLMNPVFFVGLALLMCGILLMLCRLFSSSFSGFFDKPMQFGIFSAGVIAVISLAAFFWSYLRLPPETDSQQYYELLFWGGGHVLQFVHTQMLLVCWVMLIRAVKPDFFVAPKWLYVLFSIGLIAALTAPAGYFQGDVSTFEHRNFFTQLMIMAGGVAPGLLAIFLILPVWKTRAKNALWASLTMSLLLFIYGGVLAGMIQGQNVVIPAHYHGSIVGVTLAFMGVAYLLLPHFGYRDVSKWKLAFWQPIIYGGGQFLHVSGFAWSGGYGVLRKTPGGLDGVSTSVKVAMGVMETGGLIAIIGGFMFVIVVGKAVCVRIKTA